MITRAVCAALAFAMYSSPAASQSGCTTWVSSPGAAVMELLGEDWPEFRLTLADGTIHECAALGGGRFNYVRWARCDGAEVGDDWPPIFFVPFDPDAPQGEGVFVFDTVPFYEACS